MYKVSAIIGWLCCTAVIGASAQMSPDQNRVLIARDVCVGIAANFISTQRGNISYQAGRFRVEQGGGSITVFEGASKITEIPGFTYVNYINCLDTMYSHFEQTRASLDSRKTSEAFMAAYELNTILNIGVCMRAVAMGGGQFMSLERNDALGTEEMLQKGVIAASNSITRRVRRFSSQNVRLGIVGNLQLYKFYSGRMWPYFESDVIQRANYAVEDVAPSEYEEYVKIGRIAGRMRQAFMYTFGTAAGLEGARVGFDQLSSLKRHHYPNALNCLGVLYRQDVPRLQESANDLGITTISIPSLESAMSGGQAVAQRQNSHGNVNTSAQTLFEARVTARIRASIRNTP